MCQAWSSRFSNRVIAFFSVHSTVCIVKALSESFTFQSSSHGMFSSAKCITGVLGVTQKFWEHSPGGTRATLQCSLQACSWEWDVCLPGGSALRLDFLPCRQCSPGNHAGFIHSSLHCTCWALPVRRMVSLHQKQDDPFSSSRIQQEFQFFKPRRLYWKPDIHSVLFCSLPWLTNLAFCCWTKI